jgi:NAD(P)-dependent dehydrogenase (short-subunit alcohol dehydrogenase family)
MQKTVFITGCSSGIGKATALMFARAGWNVAATMRNPTHFPAADLDEHVTLMALDVRSNDAIKAGLSDCIDHFGRIDCVVNNAGQGLLSVFEATPIDLVRDLFETNTFGIMQITQAILPHFRAWGSGSLVNVTSAAAISTDPLMAVYDASKWAVEGFTEALHYELEPHGIAVKLIEPGFVPTTNMVRQIQERSQVVPVPSVYRAIVDRAVAHYMAGAKALKLATEEDVASCILTAATDGNRRQLRYVVGEDAELAAHKRRSTSESEYMAWVRSRLPA